MNKKRLNQYRGKLDANQIAGGINAAIRNAARLIDDAKQLFDAGKFPSAAALAILAIEESGKISIFRSLALAKDENQVRDAWRDYRSHTKKNAMWMLPQLAAKGARKLNDFRSLYDEDADHPYLLDQVKQISLYTDCLGTVHWSIPEEVVDEDLAKSLVQIAEILAKEREVQPLEIELWIKHLSPAWMTHADWMKGALENWYADMQEHGLAEEGLNQMEEFTRRGLQDGEPDG